MDIRLSLDHSAAGREARFSQRACHRFQSGVAVGSVDQNFEAGRERYDVTRLFQSKVRYRCLAVDRN